MIVFSFNLTPAHMFLFLLVSMLVEKPNKKAKQNKVNIQFGFWTRYQKFRSF